MYPAESRLKASLYNLLDSKIVTISMLKVIVTYRIILVRIHFEKLGFKDGRFLYSQIIMG